jgi:hypothetical protein
MKLIHPGSIIFLDFYLEERWIFLIKLLDQMGFFDLGLVFYYQYIKKLKICH